MPYASDSQRRLFHAKEARGEMKHSTVSEFDKASIGMDAGGEVCPHCGQDYSHGGVVHGEPYDGELMGHDSENHSEDMDEARFGSEMEEELEENPDEDEEKRDMYRRYFGRR